MNMAFRMTEDEKYEDFIKEFTRRSLAATGLTLPRSWLSILQETFYKKSLWRPRGQILEPRKIPPTI